MSKKEGVKFKDIFVPHYQSGWYFCEIDLSQIEIRTIALLTGCTNLIAHLINGVDMHRRVAGIYYKKSESDVTTEERKFCKFRSFELLYGASVKGIAKSGNMSESEAGRYYDTFFNMYPELLQWRTDLMDHAKKNQTPTGKHTEGGYPETCWMHVCPITAKRYMFTSKDNKYAQANPHIHLDKVRFLPTEVGNWPNQGLATGDLMGYIRGELFRHILRLYRDRVIMRNTVHDDLLFSINTGFGTHVDLVVDLARTTEALIEQFFEEHNTDTKGLPFPVGVKVGPRMGSLVEVEEWTKLGKLEEAHSFLARKF